MIDFVKLTGPGNCTQDQNLYPAISQGTEISQKNQIAEEMSVLLDYTVDQRNEEKFARIDHQINALGNHGN